MNIKTILIALLFNFIGIVHADSLDINITSWHSDKSYDYNNRNFGVGYTKDLNRHWQAQGGFFKNSYDKDSLYALLNLKHDMKHFGFGVALGFVTGYDDIEVPASSDKYKYRNDTHTHPKNMNAIQFMVLPNVTLKLTKKYALSITYMPVLDESIISFFGIKYQYIL